jgi:hypothetical protein
MAAKEKINVSNKEIVVFIDKTSSLYFTQYGTGEKESKSTIFN